MIEERVCQEHLEEILRLQEEHYSEPFRTPPERLSDRLAFIQTTPPFLSWALRSQDRLSAYMFAFHAYSCVSSQPRELVVSIDDLIIEPNRPHDLFRLLSLLRDSVQEAGLETLPVETTCRRGAYEVIHKHPRIVDRLGYELIVENVFWVPEMGEELTWMRFHPVGCSQINTLDSSAWSEELREEVRARQLQR
ncbi:hypothetical protein JST97_34735 [bacterium]|nr:hypothetical protein [bacterium]